MVRLVIAIRTDNYNYIYITCVESIYRDMAENEPMNPVEVGSSPGSKGADEQDLTLSGSSVFFTVLGWVIFVIFFPITVFSSLTVLKEYERVIIFRQGRIISKRSQGPGIVFTLPWVDARKQIDLRTHVIDVPSQEILTKDSVNANVNAVVFYRIFNPYLSVINVADPHASTTLLAQSTLRSVLGSRTMFQILTDRDKLGDELSRILDEATDEWGIKVSYTLFPELYAWQLLCMSNQYSYSPYLETLVQYLTELAIKSFFNLYVYRLG